MGNEITVVQLMSMREAINALLSQRMNISLAYKFKKIIKVLNEYFEDFSEVTKDKTQEEIEDWAQNEKININIEKISLTLLQKNDIILSPIELTLLEWMIEDDIEIQ